MIGDIAGDDAIAKDQGRGGAQDASTEEIGIIAGRFTSGDSER